MFPVSGDVRASGTGRVGEEGRAMRPMKSVRSRRTLASKNQRRSPVPHCLWLEFCWGLSETGTGIGGGQRRVGYCDMGVLLSQQQSWSELRHVQIVKQVVHQFINDPLTKSSSIHQFINDPPLKVHRRNFINSSIHHDPPLKVHRRNFINSSIHHDPLF